MAKHWTRLVLLGAALGLACGGSQKKTSTLAGTDGTDKLTIPRVDESLCDPKENKVMTYDLNSDGKADVWKLYATVEEGGTTVETLTCKQVDFNHDGNKDYVAIYGRTGEMVAEEFDLTFEGSIDSRFHYDKKTGKKYLIERDTDHDRKPDVWEKFDSQERIESVRRDRNADGQPDVWEQYRDGVLIATLYGR